MTMQNLVSSYHIGEEGEYRTDMLPVYTYSRNGYELCRFDTGHLILPIAFYGLCCQKAKARLLSLLHMFS